MEWREGCLDEFFTLLLQCDLVTHQTRSLHLGRSAPSLKMRREGIFTNCAGWIQSCLPFVDHVIIHYLLILFCAVLCSIVMASMHELHSATVIPHASVVYCSRTFELFCKSFPLYSLLSIENMSNQWTKNVPVSFMKVTSTQLSSFGFSGKFPRPISRSTRAACITKHRGCLSSGLHFFRSSLAASPTTSSC